MDCQCWELREEFFCTTYLYRHTRSEFCVWEDNDLATEGLALSGNGASAPARKKQTSNVTNRADCAACVFKRKLWGRWAQPLLIVLSLVRRDWLYVLHCVRRAPHFIYSMMSCTSSICRVHQINKTYTQRYIRYIPETYRNELTKICVTTCQAMIAACKCSRVCLCFFKRLQLGMCVFSYPERYRPARAQ